MFLFIYAHKYHHVYKNNGVKVIKIVTILIFKLLFRNVRIRFDNSLQGYYNVQFIITTEA